MQKKLEETPGGALAVFSAFVCGAVLCAVNIEAVYPFVRWIKAWQSLLFAVAALSGCFLSCGSWVITLNALLFGGWSCAMGYALRDETLSVLRYSKLIFPTFVVIVGLFVVSDVGFYTADMITQAYRSFPKAYRQKGFTAIAAFSAAILIYIAIFITLK